MTEVFAMPPSSPGVLRGPLSTRLLLPLLVFLLLILALVTLWTRHTGQHYRYVTVNSMSTSQKDLSTHSYAVVIDAGSSSSKVHLFHWPPHDGDPQNLLRVQPLMDEMGDPLSKKVEPGISTFASTPQAAFNSLIPLIAFASTHIPRDKHSNTVLYLLGTAGMRLLSKEEQDKMVNHLTVSLTEESPFHLPKDGIQVISGQMEGVFSWITINYLLGHFSPESHAHPADGVMTDYIHTVGVMDMGGASLQIAFEVPQQAEVSSEHMVEINLGCGAHDSKHRHRVYSKTYLGYGSNTARTEYQKGLVRQHLNESSHNHSSSDKAHPVLKDPCTQKGLVENITLNKHSMRVKGLGDFASCKKELAPLLTGGSENRTEGTSGEGYRCGHKECVEKVFERPPGYLGYTSMEFYGTSEFWYTMRDVLRMGGAYSAGEFERKSVDFCQTDWYYVRDRFAKQLYTYADSYRLRSQCLKSAWLSLVLHEALQFPTDSISLKTTAFIGGQSVQWPLGALLYFLRYLPLREVQLQQQQLLKSTQTTHWELKSVIQSSFVPPFLVVLFVIFLLLICRHRRSSTPLLSPGSNLRLPRSLSHASGLKVHRRGSSVSAPLYVPRNQSNTKLAWIV